MGVLSECISEHCVHGAPKDIRRGRKVFWNWVTDSGELLCLCSESNLGSLEEQNVLSSPFFFLSFFFWGRVLVNVIGPLKLIGVALVEGMALLTLGWPCWRKCVPVGWALRPPVLKTEVTQMLLLHCVFTDCPASSCGNELTLWPGSEPSQLNAFLTRVAVVSSEQLKPQLRQKLVTRDWSSVVITQTMLLSGGIWTLILWVMKVLLNGSY